MTKYNFSQEQIDDIISKYNSNWTQQQIAENYNVSRIVIKRILTENNITFRQKTRKYFYQQNIFEKIDTAEKAYWLGFLAADGCNYIGHNRALITINLHQKDIEHLQKFKAFCKTNVEIDTYIAQQGFSNNTPMCKITLNSLKMANDLFDKGIVPNKSLILQPPNIQEQFYKPFILGYFDGDGSINKSSQHCQYSVNFQGTKEILVWIGDVLSWDIHLEQKKSMLSKNAYYIRCGGTKKPYELMKQLYNSCEIHLERKFQIYKTLETVVLNRNVK